MNHEVFRVDNLMYDGCEPHWKCKHCGICIPFHCFTKEQLENQECKARNNTQKTVKEKDHEHTIGVWNDYDNTQLVTLSELKKVFRNDFDVSCWLYYDTKGEPAPVCIAKTRPSFDKKWKNHFDWRCNTNLTRFTHCPFCGEKLNWREMKKETWWNESNSDET